MTISASDAAGNTARIFRTFLIYNHTSPRQQLVVLHPSPLEIPVYSTFPDPGAALVSIDEGDRPSVSYDSLRSNFSNISTSKTGRFVATYVAAMLSAHLQVHVVDTTPPVSPRPLQSVV